jgi:hypothetical protein
MEDDDKKSASEAETPTATPSPVAPVAPAPQRAPSDKDVFFRLLPKLCESFATRFADPKTIMALSVELAREETGRMADLGVCERTIMCYDGRPLALQVYFTPPEQRSVQQQPAPAPNQHPQQQGALPLANTNGRGLQGQMVAHWETHSVQKIHGL